MAPLAPSDNPLKNCAIIGLGYIGSPTAVVVPNTGFKVIGVDINRHTGALRGLSQKPMSAIAFAISGRECRHTARNSSTYGCAHRLESAFIALIGSSWTRTNAL